MSKTIKTLHYPFTLIQYHVGILLTFSLCIIQGCNFEDCGECFTPPIPITFEILDHDTRENLFSNGTYNPDELTIENINDNSIIPFKYFSESNQIVVSSIGWKTETVNYIFKIDTDSLFTLHVDAERISEECCSFTRYNEILIENSSYEFTGDTEVYSILVD